jgi:hypothetical protein
MEQRKPRPAGSGAVIAASVALFALIVGLAHLLGVEKKEPIQLYTFQKSLGQFKPVGEPEGKAEVDHSPPGMEPGQGALRYTYENQVDHFTGVGSLSVPVSGFSSIHVEVYSREERTLGIVIDELDSGAVYVYTFKAKGGAWTRETCVPDLFLPSSGSSDADGRLDHHRLNSRIIVADMSGFEGNIGPNTFWISRIEILKREGK